MVTGVFEKWLDPRHAEREAKREIARLTMAVDSLEQLDKMKDRYIDNLSNLVTGQDDQYAEVENRELSDEEIEASENSTEDLNEADMEFRREFEEENLGNLTLNTTSETLQDIFLFNPVNKDAVVISKFDPKINHYGLDILARKDEPIKSAGDGTVIFAGWTVENGHVLAIQHRSNLISIYKHNSELLKKVGNFVSQGEIISIIGNTGELTTGPHLHFELWYNGNPVDPGEFIDF